MTTEYMENAANTWNKIPDLALVKILEYLPKHEQFIASTVCSHWRDVFFQKRFFREFKFRLAIGNDRQCVFFRESLCHLVKELTIIFDFVNIYHVEKIRRILYKAARCDNIQAIRFETNNAGLLPPGDICESNLVNIEHLFVQPIKLFLNRKNNPCKILDLGGVEAITYYGVELIRAITKPQEITTLTLASVKYDPSHYPILTVEGSWFEKFTALQVFSIDYDSLNEEIMHALQILPLKKFLIVVHGLDRNHPGISETSWSEFSKHFTDIELYLSLIYAFEAVEVLQVRLFRRNMPITHFRVLFCDFMNVDALDWMSIHNNKTLKSVKWIDSAYKQNGKNVMDLFLRSGQDPFVMMAWRCKNLEEIVVHGYVMDPHNIVGISRLRGRTLKHLEISMIDTTPPEPSMDSFIEEINTLLGQKWAPLDPSTLHPAIGYFPVMEDVRDEYIFSTLRKDLAN